MTTPASRAVLVATLSLLTGSAALADDPDAATIAVQVLPSHRTPVYVWPIMRGCQPDHPVTAAVVRKLDADVGLQVRRLAIPDDPAFLGCLGTGCAELLGRAGCAARSGILVGGEIDEVRCDASDRSLAGCTGQLVSRLRVFRLDLDHNQPTRGDFRYALCEDGRCGSAGTSVAEAVAQLLAQLVATSELPSPPAAPRARPEPEEQCTASASGAAAPSRAPPVAEPSLAGKTVSYAYYTQYKHLGSGGGPEAHAFPTREQAEKEAQARATHFTEGVSLPAGPQYVAATLNTKYTLLPGEELVGNFWRATTLHGYLITPPPGAEYALFRQAPAAQRLLIILILDNEAKSLATFLIEPNRALRPVAPPAACAAGGGESPTCRADAIAAALAAVAEPSPRAAAAPAALALAQRPLGCIPYSERRCPGCATPPAFVAAPPPILPPLQPTNPRKWTDRFLYATMGVAVLTAGLLTIADSVSSTTLLTDSQGDYANVTGLLRPAEWTAWGLTLALAIPTAISVVENGRSSQRASAATSQPGPPPRGPHCPISEQP